MAVLLLQQALDERGHVVQQLHAALRHPGVLRHPLRSSVNLQARSAPAAIQVASRQESSSSAVRTIQSLLGDVDATADRHVDQSLLAADVSAPSTDRLHVFVPILDSHFVSIHRLFQLLRGNEKTWLVACRSSNKEIMKRR